MTRQTRNRQLQQQRSADLLKQLQSHLDRINRVTRPMLQVTYDPHSEPEARDVVGLSLNNGAYGALAGGRIGLLLGTLFDEPEIGTKLGLLFGGVAGAAHGANQVQQGWRIHMKRYDSFQPE